MPPRSLNPSELVKSCETSMHTSFESVELESVDSMALSDRPEISRPSTPLPTISTPIGSPNGARSGLESEAGSSIASANDVDGPRKKLGRAAEKDDLYGFNWDMAFKMKHGPGLYNDRHDGYLNAVLHFIFHTPQMVKFLRSKGKHCQQDLCIVCSMSRLLNDFTKRNVRIIYCAEVKKCVNRGFPTLSYQGMQEDAHEMLIFVLKKLETPIELRSRLSSGTTSPSEVHQIFGGVLSRKVACSNCKNISKGTEEFRELNLNLNQDSNMPTGPALNVFVDGYFKPEPLKDFRCGQCQSIDTTIRSFTIQDAPKILVIQLKRFDQTGAKIDLPISMPEVLDLTDHNTHENSLTYRLYGFISHYGSTIHNGEYVATMRGYDGKFYRFHEEVREARVNSDPTPYPYILFYAKTSTL